MHGHAVHGVMSEDRTLLATLYRNPANTDEPAFVHVLDLQHGWSYCADLPVPFGTGAPGTDLIELTKSRHGRRRRDAMRTASPRSISTTCAHRYVAPGTDAVRVAYRDGEIAIARRVRSDRSPASNTSSRHRPRNGVRRYPSRRGDHGHGESGSEGHRSRRRVRVLRVRRGRRRARSHALEQRRARRRVPRPGDDHVVHARDLRGRRRPSRRRASSIRRSSPTTSTPSSPATRWCGARQSSKGAFGTRRIAFVEAPGGIRLEFMEQIEPPPEPGP